MDQEQVKNIQEYFKKNNYVVIKGFLTPDIAGLMYRYCTNKVINMDFKTTFDREAYRHEWDGEFGDPQISGSYNCYGDVMMDTLLEASTPSMNAYTGKNLVPTYSYWRFYQKGDILDRHRDRKSCEISTTLCLGYNTSNVNPKEYPDYNWPMYIEDISGETDGLPVHMEPGDMVIYRGTILDHWRDKFIGLNHAQVFLHYNDSEGPYNIQYDGRPCLGIPSKFSNRRSNDV